MLTPRKCFQRLLGGGHSSAGGVSPLQTPPSSTLCHQAASCCPPPGARYLFREAPSASTMGSAISIMDCSVEVTTMKRMMLRRKVRCRTCRSSSPVCSASSSSVTPSVTPLPQTGG